jgi:hypothetical protein
MLRRTPVGKSSVESSSRTLSHGSQTPYCVRPPGDEADRQTQNSRRIWDK